MSVPPQLEQGTLLAVGDPVRFHGRPCRVIKFDKGYPALVLIEDPGGCVPYKSTEATKDKPAERWVRIDELEGA